MFQTKLINVKHAFTHRRSFMKCIPCQIQMSSIPLVETKNADNELQHFLIQKIKMKGPLTVAEYMKNVLGNQLKGYYMKKDVFGKSGDFITSPEVSQMFGELVGVWFANEWLLLKDIYKEDLPKKVAFVELGPGRGTLMTDVMRVFNKASQVPKDVIVYLIEMSNFMRTMQFKNLCNSEQEFTPKTLETYESKNFPSTKFVWLDDISDLSLIDAPHFFLANEFFDALPIHKFEKNKENNSYFETLIDYDVHSNKFKFVTPAKKTLALNYYLKLHPNYNKFDHVELSIESARVMESMAKKLSDSNGSMLIIDYGHNGLLKDTFRAFKNHKLSDPLEDIGNCDLTADVDFSFLRHIAENSGVQCYGPTTQASFLSEMQISKRLETLISNVKSAKEKDELISQYDMLTNKEKMGERFKFFAIRRFKFNAPVPGFK